MSEAATFLFATALAAACATPGPTTTALVARVLARGRRGVALMCMGLLLGEVFWLLCATFGVAALAQQFHPVFVAIKYLGVAYLLYLAWKFWIAPVAPGATAPASSDDDRPLLTGLSIALGNPKTMLFYVALLPSIVTLDGLPLRNLLLLVAIVIVVVGAVLAAYVLLAMRMRLLIRSPAVLRRVNRGSGALMAGAAAAIATR